MNSHRISVPSWVPDFDFIEDIARILNVSSADLRERLCPIDAMAVRRFRDWLSRKPLTDVALAEIGQAVLSTRHAGLVAIEVHFDRLLGAAASAQPTTCTACRWNAPA